MTFTHIDPAVIHEAAHRGDHVYPYAEYRPLPEAGTQPTIDPWNFILHTMGGENSASGAALYNWISRPGNNGEPHVLLGYRDLIQAVPFNVRADNNADANRWFAGGRWRGAVSVETQDDGTKKDPGIAKAAWNTWQLEHLAGVAAFLHLRYGNPIARCATWDSRGVDGHRAHDEWSIYVGKSCPGDTRWGQIPHIFELARQIVDWRPGIEPPTSEVPDMAGIRHKRILDTRQQGGMMMANEVRTVNIPATIPRPNWARSAMVKIGVAGSSGGGWISADATDPTDAADPADASSVVEWDPGQTTSNTTLVTVEPITAGLASARFKIRALVPTHVIIDMQGWAA